jgi:hypothetical protein
MKDGSFFGVAALFVAVIGASAIIFQLNKTGGQKNVSTVGNTFTQTVGDAFKSG